MADTFPLPIVGVLKESAPGERRVALTPPDIGRLAKRVSVLVERGAGAEAGYPDSAYAEAGAKLADRSATIAAAQVLLAIRAPDDLARFPSGVVLASLGGRDTAVEDSARAHGIRHLGLERLPRTTRAQAMDVLSSQATVAGYAAVIEGARALDSLLPMLTTAAGTVKPAKMIALGAGVAGLQAIATARRLGAVVHGFDVRDVAREQVESLGARFISLGEAQEAQETANGYAGEQTLDKQAALRRALTSALADMQLIVTSAQIPGRRAPLLIDDETLAALKPGTVIVDLAADTGGNTSRTQPEQTLVVGGVTILGSSNLPSLMAGDASRLWSSNMRALLEHLVSEAGDLRLDDPITSALLGVEDVQRSAA